MARLGFPNKCSVEEPAVTYTSNIKPSPHITMMVDPLYRKVPHKLKEPVTRDSFLVWDLNQLWLLKLSLLEAVTGRSSPPSFRLSWRRQRLT